MNGRAARFVNGRVGGASRTKPGRKSLGELGIEFVLDTTHTNADKLNF